MSLTRAEWGHDIEKVITHSAYFTLWKTCRPGPLCIARMLCVRSAYALRMHCPCVCSAYALRMSCVCYVYTLCMRCVCDLTWKLMSSSASSSNTGMADMTSTSSVVLVVSLSLGSSAWPERGLLWHFWFVTEVSIGNVVEEWYIFKYGRVCTCLGYTHC